MCGADSEVSRWLIHQYPDLLNVEDFQRDTPLFIALKECSYFLLKYGEQLDGYVSPPLDCPYSLPLFIPPDEHDLTSLPPSTPSRV